ncbi:sensor histidine kinase [Hymenobacter terrestris]|uniref:Histidine kinase n=1 Tax=Hymenobacter terrestris TaxID=2748310 RepID=A0ABX2Q1F7_9BACT|nr:histidine kinase [Hymenobacter terrestris]NVO84107.1 histidine kinase [Hymenobacter terrestris]
MNRNKIIGYHVLAWGLLIGYDWLGIAQNKEATRTDYLLQTTFRMSLVVVFYYCFLFPRYLRSRRLPLLVGGLLAAPLVFMTARYLLQEVLLPLTFGIRNYDAGTSLRLYAADNLLYSLPIVVVAAVAWGVEDVFVRDKNRLVQEKERENQQLLQEKTQAELAFLKTQINPHFLYNTLNYIYAQAYPVSEPLAEAVLRLSELMRYMLHESPDGQVDLRREVAYLENYLALHRLRFEEKFFVDFHQPDPVADQRVAALVLIPFVENALKHGLVHRPDCPVTITLRLPEPDTLHFEVHNYISHQQKDATTGIGLPNLRRRLELLYPGRYHLAVHNDGRTHHTRLELRLS